MRVRALGLTAACVASLLTSAAARQGAPAVDPCTLVSRADVEQILGKLKAPPTSDINEQTKLCSYQFANGSDEMEIWVFPASGLDRARQSFKDLAPVTDLGHEAFQRRHPDIGWIELYTRKGDITLEVTMRATSGDLEKAKALARKALARL